MSVWLLMVVLSSIGWASRSLGLGTMLHDWAPSDQTPLITIASGLFVLPLGTLAAAMFLLPVMPVAYPMAVAVERRVVGRRRVAAIGAVMGGLLAPVMLAATAA